MLAFMLEQGKSEIFDNIFANILVILHKLDPNRQLFGRCDNEIWQMTSKNNRESFPWP